jgi:hypothetical protein
MRWAVYLHQLVKCKFGLRYMIIVLLLIDLRASERYNAIELDGGGDCSIIIMEWTCYDMGCQSRKPIQRHLFRGPALA